MTCVNADPETAVTVTSAASKTPLVVVFDARLPDLAMIDAPVRSDTNSQVVVIAPE